MFSGGLAREFVKPWHGFHVDFTYSNDTKRFFQHRPLVYNHQMTSCETHRLQRTMHTKIHNDGIALMIAKRIFLTCLLLSSHLAFSIC
jgi:hypothetical protein